MSSQLLNAKNMIFSVPSNLTALSHTDDKSSAEAPPTPPLSLPISNIASCPVVPVKPIPMNDSMVAASQFLRNLQNAGVDIGKLPNLSCDECSQLAAKVIPYAENRAQPAPDRTLGHKHEVNRDVAQRMQTERTTVNQIREEDTVGE